MIDNLKVFPLDLRKHSNNLDLADPVAHSAQEAHLALEDLADQVIRENLEGQGGSADHLDQAAPEDLVGLLDLEESSHLDHHRLSLLSKLKYSPTDLEDLQHMQLVREL
ncbi:MAG: hypothetical protein K0R31_1378 [Clostridiales bacterium]|jgi:hypothetical protein|nr:hypothetical protein [Clostridiales bacterium]